MDRIPKIKDTRQQGTSPPASPSHPNASRSSRNASARTSPVFQSTASPAATPRSVRFMTPRLPPAYVTPRMSPADMALFQNLGAFSLPPSALESVSMNKQILHDKVLKMLRVRLVGLLLVWLILLVSAAITIPNLPADMKLNCGILAGASVSIYLLASLLYYFQEISKLDTLEQLDLIHESMNTAQVMYMCSNFHRFIHPPPSYPALVRSRSMDTLPLYDEEALRMRQLLSLAGTPRGIGPYQDMSAVWSSTYLPNSSSRMGTPLTGPVDPLPLTASQSLQDSTL